MSDAIIAAEHHDRPVAFTQDEIGWAPWLEPLAESELTDRHWAGLVDASRAKSPYFMLLARDPQILEARTRTDKDIFYNPAAGLPRAERELSAAAASRANGCIFCASVHARFATTHSRRGGDVQRLLDEGVAVDIDARWNAIIAASVALTDDAAGVRRGGDRTPAGGRPRRPCDRRCDPRRRLLQLGQPADAFAGRTDGGGERLMDTPAMKDRMAMRWTTEARTCRFR